MAGRCGPPTEYWGNFRSTPSVDILLVGVAPTRQGGRNKGTHFYSSPRDPLRASLFRLLSEEPFSLSLTGPKMEDNIKLFHKAKLFFVHAAKIRPLLKDAPPTATIAFCAKRHLLEEIQLIHPKAVCILGKTHVGLNCRCR